MRSGWDAEAHWSFFDIGPWGTGHQHNDKLHLSVHAHGRDLLVDAGRFWYEGGPIREYALSSAAHNVVLLDGLGQVPDRHRAASPTPLTSVRDGFDFAMGRFDRGFTDIRAGRSRHAMHRGSHTRAVVYLRGLGWLVFDRLSSERPSRPSALWHFHPACTVQVEGTTVRTTDTDAGNVALRPVAGVMDWQVDLHLGRETPTPQGWYSEQSYETWYRNVCAEFRAKRVATPCLTAWLISPGRGEPPACRVQALSESPDHLQLQLAWSAGENRVVTVRLAGGGPIDLPACRVLHGRCAVQMGDAEPEPACGAIADADGRMLREDRRSPEALLEHALDESHISADDSAAPDARQRLVLTLHNPWTDGPVRYRCEASAQNPTPTPDPQQGEITPGRTARITLHAEPPFGRAGEEDPVETKLEAGGASSAVTRRAALRPAMEIPALPADTDLEHLPHHLLRQSPQASPGEPHSRRGARRVPPRLDRRSSRDPRRRERPRGQTRDGPDPCPRRVGAVRHATRRPLRPRARHTTRGRGRCVPRAVAGTRLPHRRTRVPHDGPRP